MDWQEAFLDSDTSNFSDLKECCLVYIGGFVVRKIQRSSTCKPCSLALITTEVADPKYKLIKMKSFSQNGASGLLFPSDSVVRIIQSAEKVISYLLKLHGGKLPADGNIILSIQANALKDILDNRVASLALVSLAVALQATYVLAYAACSLFAFSLSCAQASQAVHVYRQSPQSL